MELEEYRKQRNLLYDEEAALKRKVQSLNHRYLEELPFKVGDKVNVKGFGVCWIRFMQVTYFGKLDLWVFPPKKNGERSNKCQRCYLVYENDIEIIERYGD